MCRTRRRAVTGLPYANTSIPSALAAALLGSENWIRQSGITSTEVDGWLDHMWTWLGPIDFDDWFSRSRRLTQTQRGGPLPAEVYEESVRAGIPPDDLLRVIIGVTDIVYANLFAAITWSWVEESLDRVANVLSKYELGLPPPEVLPPSSRDENGGGGAIHSSVVQSRSSGGRTGRSAVDDVWILATPRSGITRR